MENIIGKGISQADLLKGYFGKDLYGRICQEKFEGINLIRGFAENICGSSL